MSIQRRGSANDTRRQSASGTGSHASPCGNPDCSRPVAPLDHKQECSKCHKTYHLDCIGFNDEAKRKAFRKVYTISPYVCERCLQRLDQLEARVALLESKLASQGQSSGKAIEPGMSPTVVANLVTQVCENLLPKLADMVGGLVKEGLEIESKKKNLVLVGLSNDIVETDFVNSACEKMHIDRADVAECFRDGQAGSDGGSRIVKIKFVSMRSRRSFLTGFYGVRAELSASSTYVRPDLTFEQRKQDRLLREKLKERREAGENVKIYRGQIVPKE